ncbi:tetratricopeptide repeat protein [Desulfoplanes sp.]
MQSMIIRTIVLLFLLLTLVPGSTRAEDRLSVPQQRVLYRAQQAMDKDDYPMVRETLSSYLKHHPDTEPVLFFLVLGNACYQQGDLGAAATWYRAGLDKHPDNLSLCRNLAAARYGLGHFAKAGMLFGKAYKHSTPREDGLLYQSAIAFYQAEQLEQSRRVLEQLIKTAKPVRREWLTLMIQICYAQHDLKRSTQLLESFLEAYPSERAYWKLLAGIRTEQERYAQAAAALRTTLSIGNATAQEWKELGSLYFYLNAPLQGTLCLEKGSALSTKPRNYDDLARGYLRAHRIDKSMHYIDLAIAQDPTAERLMTKARTLMTARRFKDAITTLQAIVAMDTEDGDQAWLLMGYCAMENQDWDQAATWLTNVKNDRFVNHARSALQSISLFLEHNHPPK